MASTARDLNSLLSDSTTVDRLTRIYGRVVERIIRQMAAGISRPGAARVNELLRQVDNALSDLDPKKRSVVRNWIQTNAPKAFVLGDRDATAELRKFLRNLSAENREKFGPVNSTWTGINNTAMAAVAAQMNNTLSNAHGEMRSFIGSVIRRTQVTLLQSSKILEATSGGFIRGATGQQVADDIASILLQAKVRPEVRKRLEEIGFRGDMFDDFERVARGEIIRVGKRRMSVRSYSDLVARTQMREIHKTATVTRLKQNEVDHVKISQHVMKEPDECTPFAGKVYYVGPLAKDPLGFPKLSSILNGGPPFHPNCKHVLIPYVVHFKTPAQIEAEKELSQKTARRFYGDKSSSDIRDLVNEMSDKELEAMNPVAMKLTG